MGGYSLEGCWERWGWGKQGSPGKTKPGRGPQGHGVRLVVFRSPGDRLEDERWVGAWTTENPLPPPASLLCLFLSSQPGLGLGVPAYRSMLGTHVVPMPFLHFLA